MYLRLSVHFILFLVFYTFILNTHTHKNNIADSGRSAWRLTLASWHLTPAWPEMGVHEQEGHTQVGVGRRAPDGSRAVGCSATNTRANDLSVSDFTVRS